MKIEIVVLPRYPQSRKSPDLMTVQTCGYRCRIPRIETETTKKARREAVVGIVDV